MATQIALLAFAQEHRWIEADLARYRLARICRARSPVTYVATVGEGVRHRSRRDHPSLE